MSKTVTFPKWATNIARARGGEKNPAVIELAAYRRQPKEYKNAAEYAKRFPNLHKRYELYCTRGSQSKKAA
jgi:hypothetical protein